MRPIAAPAARVAAAVALALLVSCADMPGRGRVVALGGIRLYYEARGYGRPLLLLHGGGGSGRQFSNQVPFFERHFRVIVPDLRAQGRTSDGPGPLTYHRMADDVLALMDHLRVKRADVMGWSDGGIVGLDLAIHHPERVGHLALFGVNFTPAGFTPAAADWIAGASAESFGGPARAEYERDAPDPSHYDIAMGKIIAMWRTQPTFTLAQLRAVRASTLVAAGEHDMIALDHTRDLARAIPGAKMWIVPSATHAVILEQPALVNHTVLEFLHDHPIHGTRRP